MIMKLNINDRAALAIRNNTKRVEIRVNKENSEHDYSKLKENDIIEFTSNNLGVFYVKVKEVNHYNSLEELFTIEGTRYTTQYTNDKVDYSGETKSIYFNFLNNINLDELEERAEQYLYEKQYYLSLLDYFGIYIKSQKNKNILDEIINKLQY